MRAPTPDLLGSGEVGPDPNWHMALHRHPFHEIIVVTQGRMHLTIGTEQLTASAGDVLFYHAGRVHEERSDARRPVATQFLSLRAGAAIDLPTRISDEGGRIRELMGWLRQDWRAQADARFTTCLLQAILLQMERLTALRDSPWLVDLRHRMRGNLFEDLDLATLAGWASMSKFAFARKYKRMSGRSPIQELRMMRLDHARNLVLTTNLPLKQIALASHLGDESQLSKLFHRHFGLWPSEIRVRP